MARPEARLHTIVLPQHPPPETVLSSHRHVWLRVVSHPPKLRTHKVYR